MLIVVSMRASITFAVGQSSEIGRYEVPREESLSGLGIGMPIDDFQIAWIRYDVTESLKRAVMYSIGSKRHRLQSVKLSQRTQAAVQIVSNLPAHSNGGPIYHFIGHAGHADPMDGWRCCSQSLV